MYIAKVAIQKFSHYIYLYKLAACYSRSCDGMPGLGLSLNKKKISLPYIYSTLFTFHNVCFYYEYITSRCTSCHVYFFFVCMFPLYIYFIVYKFHSVRILYRLYALPYIYTQQLKFILKFYLIKYKEEQVRKNAYWGKRKYCAITYRVYCITKQRHSNICIRIWAYNNNTPHHGHSGQFFASLKMPKSLQNVSSRQKLKHAQFFIE